MAEKLLQRYGIFLDCANQNAGKNDCAAEGEVAAYHAGQGTKRPALRRGRWLHIMRSKGRKSLRGEGGRFQKNNYWKNSLKKYLLLFAVVKKKQYFCRLFLRE